MARLMCAPAVPVSLVVSATLLGDTLLYAVLPVVADPDGYTFAVGQAL